MDDSSRAHSHSPLGLSACLIAGTIVGLLVVSIAGCGTRQDATDKTTRTALGGGTNTSSTVANVGSEVPPTSEALGERFTGKGGMSFSHPADWTVAKDNVEAKLENVWLAKPGFGTISVGAGRGKGFDPHEIPAAANDMSASLGKPPSYTDIRDIAIAGQPGVYWMETAVDTRYHAFNYLASGNGINFQVVATYSGADPSDTHDKDRAAAARMIAGSLQFK